MNTNETLEQMKELRLSGMALTYNQQLELPIHQQLDAHDLIAQLLQSEQLCRQQEKTVPASWYA
jgi:c-di-GMP-binding flagellar brake protein YcgR